MNVVPGYFHRKIDEKHNQKKSLAVWFPTNLWYLPGNFAMTLELSGNLEPSCLLYLGLGNIPIEWNKGKNLKTHLGPGFHVRDIINHSITLPYPLYPRHYDKP